MIRKEFLLNSLNDTKRLGDKIATELRVGDVVTLQGDLGSGKTELARAIVRHLMGEAYVVPSPTFTLVQTYETYKGELWHFDCYRLEDPEEVVELGLDEALAHHMTLMEWPEKIGPRSFKNHLNIQLEVDANGINRAVVAIGHVRWKPLLDTLSQDP